MTKVLCVIGLLFATLYTYAQKDKQQSIGIGLKAGYNFANVNESSSLSTSNTNGYHVGAFYSPGTTRSWGFGYRTEIIYSKQGYDFAKNNTTGTVRLNYILLPQLTTFNITKFVQLQIGIQLAFLVSAGADSSVSTPAINSFSAKSVIEYYNKFDYGFTGGVELHPLSGLLLGVRLNISLANANKEQTTITGFPSFIPDHPVDNIRNNVLQVFAGWKF